MREDQARKLRWGGLACTAVLTSVCLAAPAVGQRAGASDPGPAFASVAEPEGGDDVAAVPAPPRGCRSAARIASDLWKEFDRRTRQAGCLVPWKGQHRYIPCLLAGSKIPLKLAEDMIGFWNGMVGGGWATIGPRRLGPGAHRGTLVSTGGRLFVGSLPVNTAKATLRLRKRGGRAKTEVTVCATHPDGRTERISRFVVARGKRNRGRTYERAFENLENVILSVKLDAKSVALRFAYELEVESEPRRYDLGPVSGFADLHLHQMARLAHAGLWFWGDHDGPVDRALTPCTMAGPRGHGLPDHVAETLGMGRARHGTPDPDHLGSWPQWDDVAHQQVHGQWLRQAHQRGLNLVVVSAVNFEPFCYFLRALYPNRNPNWRCRDMENVRRQLRAAMEFDRRHDWYEIAADPWHARKIIHEGKLAVVLSLEASHLLPRDEGDFVAQLDRLYGEWGLRTLQLAHETDSRFAGAAPHRWIFEVLNWIKGLDPRNFDAQTWESIHGASGFALDTQGKNKRGLTGNGARLVKAMMDRNMPIDIAHLSERSVRDVYELAKRNRYYPLYDSHTRFRAVLRVWDLDELGELMTTREQLRFLESTGGMVGLRTGDNSLRAVAPGVENSCPGSSRSFAQMVQFGARRSRLAMGFGSDLNGFISQVGPRLGPSACHKLSSDPDLQAAARDAQERPPSLAMDVPRVGPRRNVAARGTRSKAGVRTRERSGGIRGRETRGTPDAAGGRGVAETFNIKGLSHVGLLPDLLNDLDAVGADTRRLRSSAEAFLRMWERAYDEERRPVSGRTIDRKREF